MCGSSRSCLASLSGARGNTCSMNQVNSNVISHRHDRAYDILLKLRSSWQQRHVSSIIYIKFLKTTITIGLKYYVLYYVSPVSIITHETPWKYFRARRNFVNSKSNFQILHIGYWILNTLNRRSWHRTRYQFPTLDFEYAMVHIQNPLLSMDKKATVAINNEKWNANPIFIVFFEVKKYLGR